MKNTIIEWFNKRNLEIREYQIDNISNIIHSSMDILLHDATGAGKTTVSICTIDLLLNDSPECNILVLPHGTDVIKGNFLSAIERLKPNFTTYVVESNPNKHNTDKIKYVGINDEIPKGVVVVGIPHAIKNINVKFDYIVIDEPHEFYSKSGGMVEGILKYSEGVMKKKILMTATPNTAILQNKHKYDWLGTDYYTLRKLGHVCNIKISLAFINDRSYDLNTDFHNNELIEGVHVDTANGIDSAIDRLSEIVVDKMLNHVNNPFENKISIMTKLKRSCGKLLFNKLQKTIIYARNINHANEIYSMLKNKGIETTIAHSNIPNSVDILEEFKYDNTIVLVAVDMARLGYDNSELYNIIDFSMTINWRTIVQIIGRVGRLPKSGDNEKMYLKIVPANLAHVYHNVMLVALHMMDHRFFIKNGLLNVNKIRIIDINKDEKDEWDGIVAEDKKRVFDESKKVMTVILFKIKRDGPVPVDELNSFISAHTRGVKLLLKHRRKIINVNNVLLGHPIEQPEIFPVINIDDMDLAPLLMHKNHKDDEVFRVYATGTLEEAGMLIDRKMLYDENITAEEAKALIIESKLI